MSMAMVTQEEMNHRIGRGLNIQECASRLYQLGLEPAEISAILPADSNTSLTWTAADANVSGVGAVAGQTVTASIYTTEAASNAGTNTGYWTGGAPAQGGVRPQRTSVLTVFRAP